MVQPVALASATAAVFRRGGQHRGHRRRERGRVARGRAGNQQRLALGARKRIVAVNSPGRSHEALFAPVGIFFSFFSTTLATFFLLSLFVLSSAAASAVPSRHFPVEQLIDGADKVVPIRSQFVNALARDILE